MKAYQKSKYRICLIENGVWHPSSREESLVKIMKAEWYRKKTDKLSTKAIANKAPIIKRLCLGVPMNGVALDDYGKLMNSGLRIIKFKVLPSDREKVILSHLQHDQYTRLIFIWSKGQRELYLGVRIDPQSSTNYTEWRKQLITYWNEKYGITEEDVELVNGDVNVCYLPYDPNVYYNPLSIVMALDQSGEVAIPLDESASKDSEEIKEYTEIDLDTLQTDQDNVTIPVKDGKPNDQQNINLKEGSQDNQLTRLLKYEQLVRRSAKNEVVFDEPLIKWQDTPIIHKGTINTIQGKAGQSKSAAAQMFTSLLIGKADCNDQVKARRFQRLLDKITVCYIDTERAIKTEFTFAVQSILINAGYDPTEEIDNFRYTSIKNEKRESRLNAIQKFIECVRSSTADHLFVVLDVITDCLGNFNDLSQTMELTDFLGTLCEQMNITVLLVIHENPSTEKARGHIGTEIFNKSTTQMQISKSPNVKDLYSLHFKKVRSGITPDDIYLTRISRGLFIADEELVITSEEVPTQKADLIQVAAYVEVLLKDGPMSKGEIYDMLEARFGISESTAQHRINELIKQAHFMKNGNGLPAVLTHLRKGNKWLLQLEVVE